jgi:hypothetical protein
MVRRQYLDLKGKKQEKGEYLYLKNSGLVLHVIYYYGDKFWRMILVEHVAHREERFVLCFYRKIIRPLR